MRVVECESCCPPRDLPFSTHPPSLVPRRHRCRHRPRGRQPDPPRRVRAGSTPAARRGLPVHPRGRLRRPAPERVRDLDPAGATDCSAATAGCRRRPVPVEWKVAARRADALRRQARHGLGPARARPLGPRRAQRALARTASTTTSSATGSDVSPVGRTRTAPSPAPTRSAAASRSRPARTGTHGFYSAYRNMAAGGSRPRRAPRRLRLRVRRARRRWPPAAARAGRSSRRRPRTSRAGGCSTRSTSAIPTCSARTHASPGSSRGTTTRSPTTTPAPTTPRSRAPRAAAYRAWYEHQPVGSGSLPRRDGSLADLPAARLGPARAVRRARHAAVPRRRRRAAGARLTSVTPAGTRRRAPCSAATGALAAPTACAARTPAGTSWRSSVMMARLDHDGAGGDISGTTPGTASRRRGRRSPTCYASGTGVATRSSSPATGTRRSSTTSTPTSTSRIPGGRHRVRRDLDHAPTATARSTGRTTGR